MTDNEDVIKSIIKGIKYIVRNEVENSSYDKTLTGIVKKINEENTYDISIGGILYNEVPSISTNLKVNDTIKVTIPQNQYSQMFILGKIV